MSDKKLKIATGLLSVGLLTTLIIKLTTVPGGMILSGLFLGLIFVVGILIISTVLVLVLKIFVKKYSFLTLYFITTSIFFIASHYYLYSPTLKITVPKGYIGEVNLVFSNVDKDILTIDSKTYTEPVVVETDGTQINDRCVGFNPSTFWGIGKSSAANSTFEIQSLSFEIVPKDKKGQKQYYSTDLTVLVDTTMVAK